jgi:hypothetical protein
VIKEENSMLPKKNEVPSLSPLHTLPHTGCRVPSLFQEELEGKEGGKGKQLGRQHRASIQTVLCPLNISDYLLVEDVK